MRSKRRGPRPTLTAAEVATRIAHHCPTRGRLNFTLYDFEHQRYDVLPGLTLRFVVSNTGEVRRLFQMLQTVIVEERWQDRYHEPPSAVTTNEAPGDAATEAG